MTAYQNRKVSEVMPVTLPSGVAGAGYGFSIRSENKLTSRHAVVCDAGRRRTGASRGRECGRPWVGGYEGEPGAERPRARRCHGALSLRSGRWPSNRADEENQLRGIPVPARDYPRGCRDRRKRSPRFSSAQPIKRKCVGSAGPDQDAGSQHQRASDHHLRRRRERRHVHVAPLDPRDRQELNDDHDHGDCGCGVEVKRG